MHFEYAENSIMRMIFINSKSLTSVTVIFHLCMKTSMARPLLKKKKKMWLLEQRKTFESIREAYLKPLKMTFRNYSGHLGNKPRTTKICFCSTLQFTAQL